MNLREIKADEFDTFVKNQKIGFPYQISNWGEVKADTWDYFFVGLFDENEEMTGASIVLIRKFLSNNRFAYLPRGPVLSQWNRETVLAFFNGLKLMLKQRRCIYYTVDPMIVYRCEHCGKYPDLIWNPWNNPEEDFENKFLMFAEAGLKHRGFSDILSYYIQARNNVFVPLVKKDGSFFDMNELKSTFSKRTKECLGNYHKKRGIYFEKAEKTHENIRLFSQFVQLTALRKDISLRNEQYFIKMCDEMQDLCEIYFGWCDVPTYLNFLKAKEKTSASEKLAMKICSTKKILEEKGEKIPVSAMLHCFPPNQNGIRIAEYLFAGTDVETFGDLHIGSGMMYFTMEDCIKKGCQFLNLGGLNHCYDDPLFQYKSRYNSILLSYAGEWDGVVSPLKYYCIKNCVIPLAKKAVHAKVRLQRKLH